MTQPRASIDEIRGFYAKLVAGGWRYGNPRLERAFELVPREAFLPPGPWRIGVGNGRYLETPSADPCYIYQNVLVALIAERRINNGEPALHAAWMNAAAPKPNDTVVHIGAGMGYYSAILSVLVLPNGSLHAFEIDPVLAASAQQNLTAFDNVTVIHGDAVTQTTLPDADVIYVNAAVTVPPRRWLTALRPEGRLIFPWQPTSNLSVAALVSNTASGFAFKPLMPSWFIPCVGASTRAPAGPNRDAVYATRSLRLTAEQAPDATATAIYDELWFSSAPPA